MVLHLRCQHKNNIALESEQQQQQQQNKHKTTVPEISKAQETSSTLSENSLTVSRGVITGKKGKDPATWRRQR